MAARLVNGMAHKNLHYDVACSYEPNSWGERFIWYSSTGWVMWNAQLSGLLSGTTCVIYDGNPGGSKDKPDWGVLWRYAAQEKVTFFGGGAAFFSNCMKAGLDLGSIPGLQHHPRLGGHRLALERRGAAMGHRAVQRRCMPKQACSALRFGGAIFPAAPMLVRMWAAIATCPWCRVRCNAACWACRCMRSTSKANR